MRSTVVATLLCILSVRAGAATGLLVSTHREGDALVVEARADLDATAAQAWDVLTDYGRLSQFIPGLLESRVIERSGDRVIVAQKGRVGFLFFRYDIAYRMEVDEYPPTEIVARALDGSFLEMAGRYRLEAREQGIRLHYAGRFIPSFGVPRALGNAALRGAVEKQFGAMVNEIERRAQAHHSGAPVLSRPDVTRAAEHPDIPWKHCTS